MATTKKKQHKKKDRYERSVPLAWGQWRTISKPIALEPVWLLAACGAILLSLVLWFSFSPRFHVADAQVIGASRVSSEALFAASGLAQRHVLFVNGRAAAKDILTALPSVREAKVYCLLPADCVISIVEWEPVLTWQTGQETLWVDAAGGTSVALQPLESGWRINGPLPLDDAGRVEREVLISLAELTQLGIQPGEAAYRLGRGLVLNDPAGWRVVVGQGAGMEERLQVYATVREHLLAEGVQPTFVDVRFPDAPYYSETSEW
ncbi:MAG: hypothetical protein JW900_06180 [Anaerolineae bacterium]|nr:hypothetical protein [Anaerolineae bacterium]